MFANLTKFGEEMPSLTPAAANSCTWGALAAPHAHFFTNKSAKLSDDELEEVASASAAVFCHFAFCRKPPGGNEGRFAPVADGFAGRGGMFVSAVPETVLRPSMSLGFKGGLRNHQSMNIYV